MYALGDQELEIHKLLKIGDTHSHDHVKHAPSEELNHGHAEPENLPIAPVSDKEESAHSVHERMRGSEEHQEHGSNHSSRSSSAHTYVHAEPEKKTWTKSGLIVYPAIFIAAFGFFYLILNFPSIIAQSQTWFAPSEDEQILGEDLTSYYAWIGGYYFSVGDREMLEPANDLDKDGLTNMDEFTMRTNPTLFDSDSDGFNDGIELINGYNPWGEGRMTKKQTELAANIDMIRVNNRISFAVAANNSGQVLGANKINYDIGRPGKLSIPRLDMQVPIIWTQDPANFDADLTKGVVHYPGTAMPGEMGTVYISGHSSDYLWKNHGFRQIFARINALEPGDDIFIDVYGSDDKLYNYRYKVVSEKVYAPDDQSQFIDNSGKRLNLSTCWPIGTQKDRYVVSAVLEGV